MKKAALLSACLWLSACGYFSDKDNTVPPAPLVDFEESIEIEKRWSSNAGGGTDEAYLKLRPAHGDGRIYVAESDGKVFAFSDEDGKRLWTTDTDAYLTGGPGTGEAMVLVGSGEGEVIALASENGEPLWRVRVSSEILAAPRISDNIIVVRTIDGKIFGLNAINGQRLWIYDQSVPALSLRGTSPPVFNDALVIVGFDEGRLAAIEKQTGKLVWETRIALGSGRSELERMVDIDAEPIIDAGVVFVASYQGRLAALSVGNGSILWTREISTHTGLAVDDANVYISDDDSNIWALDRFTGNSLWKIDLLQARAITAPAVQGSYLTVGDLEGYLHWFDKYTSEIVARRRHSSERILAPPVVFADIVYFYSIDGTLAAYTYQE